MKNLVVEGPQNELKKKKKKMTYKGQAHVLFDSPERHLPGQVAGHMPTGKEAP